MSTCRSGTFEISNADGVQPGTKIVMYLKPDCREFSDESTINRKCIDKQIYVHMYLYLHFFLRSVEFLSIRVFDYPNIRDRFRPENTNPHFFFG